MEDNGGYNCGTVLLPDLSILTFTDTRENKIDSNHKNNFISSLHTNCGCESCYKARDFWLEKFYQLSPEEMKKWITNFVEDKGNKFKASCMVLEYLIRRDNNLEFLRKLLSTDYYANNM